MKKLLFLCVCIFALMVVPTRGEETTCEVVKNVANATEVEMAEAQLEEVLFRQIARGTGKVIKGAAQAVTPDLFKVSVYTKDGQTVEFYRHGVSAWSLKKRVSANAGTNGVLRLWGQREVNGPYVQIPGIALSNIQNIAVVKISRHGRVSYTQDSLNN